MRNLLVILSVIILAGTSCRFVGGKRIKGNGNIKSKEHSVSSFKNVDVSGAVDVYVSQGPLAPVKIETDENLLQYIEVIQEGDKIIVRTKKGYNARSTQGIKAYVTSPLYNHIDVSGACNIIGQNKITNAEDLSLEVSGAGDIRMDLNAPSVRAEVSGSGSVELKGDTKSFDLELTGAGKAKCFDLRAENVKVDISGAGDADVFASVKLSADVSGAGTIVYKGGATNVSQHVSGAGSVKKSD
ncbi:MAG: DUF2807 domain-containing protein [Gemmatimonadaceae bacterium]|nr:DUF2807 domain-containing protein [Chitinophagaceae bacterium]